MRLGVYRAIRLDELTWFDDSPDAGTLECICSYCGNVIEAEELCYRCYDRKAGTQIRLCDNCLKQLDKGGQ